MPLQSLSPIERYQSDIKINGFSFDQAQYGAMQKLDLLFQQLVNGRGQGRKYIKLLFKMNQTPLRGMYLWGGVGRGKTYLMDVFYDALPFKNKKRLHFHRFMYWVHQQLAQLDGQSDPLKIIALKLSNETQLLCFDEFYVSDIGDAMVLAVLLEEMFKLGITLVATSNIEPEKLYWNGLQRSRFLPAIDLIKRHTEVVMIEGDIDYRLRTLEQAEIYHAPLDQAAEESLRSSFSHLANHEISENVDIIINSRAIQVKAKAEGVVWLDYHSICATARSVSDYIEFSRLNHSILISNIPSLDDSINDQVRRFISLVDEFYERNVKLILSAAKPLSTLYSGNNLTFEFKRTQSRLQEMQSRQYLAKQHIP